MPQFDYFVVFAEMRTGSNFLETNLNALDGVACHGEAFNTHFIGYPNAEALLGITQAERDADPMRLLDAIRGQGDMGGFRFFNDHDARVLDIVLNDPRCAKIVLTRNPLDSYVSWKIAQATGQWKLTNVKHARAAMAEFDGPEFERHLAALQEFQIRLLKTLQRTGQTAFYLAYEDLQDLDTINGLAAWLGVPARLDALDDKLKKQNPAALSEKVGNFAEMEAALARIDRFDLTRTPNFEPRRGAAVPSYVAAAVSPLLFLPVHGGPSAAVEDWLAALDGTTLDALQRDFNQKSLRQWKRSSPGHRSFTVLRHPVARAHAAFCAKILTAGPGAYLEIRKLIRQVFKVELPGESLPPDYDAAAHRAAFEGFLTFLQANLSGQTGVRVDSFWASQAEVVRGMANFALPDMILRETDLDLGLSQLAAQLGLAPPPAPADTDPEAARLAQIYDADLEARVREIYQRDYMTFGFGPWGAAA